MNSTPFEVVSDRDLQTLNTLAVPSVASHYVRVTGAEELQNALRFAQQHHLPVLVLGGGSNLILPERFAGLVIHIAIKGFTAIAEDEQHVWLRAGAGEVWQDLVEYCLQRNYFGLENLSLIPGTVGAAPIQNIGAYGVELDSVFAELSAIDRDSLDERRFDKNACEFRYRDSIFKQGLRDKVIIVSVTFRLNKQPQFNTGYAPLKEALAQVTPEELTARKVSAAVIAIRQSKLPDPAKTPNAGSFFKNPIVDAEQFAQLSARYPDVVSYPAPQGKVKLAAAWLVDKAGWRGHSEAGLGMHSQQALVLVNPGRCSGNRILDYARRIEEDVLEKFGVALEREPLAY